MTPGWRGGDVLRVEPPVTATARWVAGDTLKLALGRPLQNARRYEVTVPTTLRALSGERLVAPVRWSFETPRPRLARVELVPEKRARFGRLLPDDRLRLFFNVAVGVETARRHLVLRANGVRLDVLAERDERDTRDPKRLLVWPRGGFPAHARVELEVPPGLPSSEGPLPSAKSTVHRFETQRPLTVEDRCDGEKARPGLRCWPMHGAQSGLELELSEPVAREELLRALRLEPAADLARHLRATDLVCDDKGSGEQSCGRSYQLRQHLVPGRAYRVSVDASLRDVFGQRLKQPAMARFATRDFPPRDLPAARVGGARGLAPLRREGHQRRAARGAGAAPAGRVAGALPRVPGGARPRWW